MGLDMRRPSAFMHQHAPCGMLLRAICGCLRYPLSRQKVVGLLTKRDATIDPSAVGRRVQKFGPEMTNPTEKHLRRARRLAYG